MLNPSKRIFNQQQVTFLDDKRRNTPLCSQSQKKEPTLSIRRSEQQKDRHHSMRFFRAKLKWIHESTLPTSVVCKKTLSALLAHLNIGAPLAIFCEVSVFHPFRRFRAHIIAHYAKPAASKAVEKMFKMHIKGNQSLEKRNSKLRRPTARYGGLSHRPLSFYSGKLFSTANTNFPAQNKHQRMFDHMSKTD